MEWKESSVVCANLGIFLSPLYLSRIFLKVVDAAIQESRRLVDLGSGRRLCHCYHRADTVIGGSHTMSFLARLCAGTTTPTPTRPKSSIHVHAWRFETNAGMLWLTQYRNDTTHTRWKKQELEGSSPPPPSSPSLFFFRYSVIYRNYLCNA